MLIFLYNLPKVSAIGSLFMEGGVTGHCQKIVKILLKEE